MMTSKRSLAQHFTVLLALTMFGMLGSASAAPTFGVHTAPEDNVAKVDDKAIADGGVRTSSSSSSSSSSRDKTPVSSLLFWPIDRSIASP